MPILKSPVILDLLKVKDFSPVNVPLLKNEAKNAKIKKVRATVNIIDGDKKLAISPPETPPIILVGKIQ